MFLFILALFFDSRLVNGQITTANPTLAACPLIKTAVINVKITTSGYLNAQSTNHTAVTFASAFTQVPRVAISLRNIRRKIILIQPMAT